MSTNDVPGANPANGDALAMGCWAEHQDGSLILVESTEAGRVIYSVFDMSKTPPVEYRDAMPEVSFKNTFTWDPKKKAGPNEKWTWHDKTAFPWDRIIKKGVSDGSRMPSADHVLNAAERVRESRERLGGLRRSSGDDDERARRAYDDRVERWGGPPKTAAERVAESLHLQGEEMDEGDHEHRMERMVSRMEGLWGRIASALENLPGGGGRRGRRR